MNQPPPLLRDQRKVDAEHLKLLAVFHFVLAGLSVAGIGFLFLHWFMMSAFFDNPEMWKNQPNPPPAEFFAIFKWFYFFAGIMIVLSAAANLTSGFLIRQRRGRIFVFIVAAINCLFFPFGTALGIFTLIVLSRDSVVELYAPREA